MMLITALLLTNVAALAPPLRTLLSRSAKPKAREEAIALITEMERDERDKFLDYVNTVRETPGKLARRPLMRYAPVSWPARDVAALDRVLAIGGMPEDDASKRRAVLSTPQVHEIAARQQQHQMSLIQGAQKMPRRPPEAEPSTQQEVLDRAFAAERRLAEEARVGKKVTS